MVLFIACENNDEFVNSYPSTLILTKYETLDNVRVFVKNGEIKDANVINNFLKDDFENNIFRSKIGVELVNDVETEIFYKSKDSASFSWEHRFGKKIPKKIGDEIFFFDKDTLRYVEPNTNDGAVGNLINQMGIYKSFRQVTPLSFGNGAVVKKYGAYIATGNTDKLEFLTMSFKLKVSHVGEYVISSNFVFNKGFDKNVISLLKVGDTLAVQNNKLIFEKLKD